MLAKRPSAIALHVEAAKRLLIELEQQALTAMSALGRENGSEFFAAVDERDRILGKLDTVVDALAHERAAAGPGAVRDPEAGAMINDVARAAATALESHEALLAKACQERDRLSVALKKTSRPDTIATRYGAAAKLGRSLPFSVTG